MYLDFSMAACSVKLIPSVLSTHLISLIETLKNVRLGLFQFQESWKHLHLLNTGFKMSYDYKKPFVVTLKQSHEIKHQKHS